MLWFTKISDFFTGLFKAFDLFSKYAPPKSTEQKVQDGKNGIEKEIDKMTDEGRP